MRLMTPIVAGMVLCCLLTAELDAQANDPRYYDIGNPTLKDIWVDANSGNDASSGETRERALRTLSAAWNQIPRGETLTTTGYLIKLAAGTYGGDEIPRFLDLRHGTAQFPVIIQSADGRGAAEISAFLNIYDCRYLYLIDLKIAPEPSETAIHLDKCDHVLMRRTTMNGRGDAPQVFKVNHCNYVYLEDCEVFGSSGSAVDFVATRNGRIIGNRIHDAGSWAVVVKGGSAYFHIEANELFNAERGGMAAGQTTGFEFLESPWLHYEAYDVKFVNNVVHDTGGAGMAVNGGYNILFAYNTLYRVGREGSLIEALYGLRVCSEDTAKCAEYLEAGGWGTKSTNGNDLQPLPNRNVYIYNNLIYNPAETGTRSTHFAIYGPQTPAPDSNIPSPVYLDQNLQIRGNIIWNRSYNDELGIEYPDVGCQASNPTCNVKQLRAENAINSFEPQLVNPSNGDFRPAPGSNVFDAKTYVIPDFDWSDAPTKPQAPLGNLSNAVIRDRNNTPREQGSPAGAYTIPTVITVSAANYKPTITAGVLLTVEGQTANTVRIDIR